MITSPALDCPKRDLLKALRDLMAQIENVTGHIAENDPDLADDMQEIVDGLNYDALVRAEHTKEARETEDFYDNRRAMDRRPVGV